MANNSFFMMTNYYKEALDKVVADFKAMLQDELKAKLNAHSNGELAIILKELRQFSEYLFTEQAAQLGQPHENNSNDTHVIGNVPSKP